MLDKKNVLSLCMKACLSLVIMVLMATTPLLAGGKVQEEKLRLRGKQYLVRDIQKLSNAKHRPFENLASDIAADKDNLDDSEVRRRLKKKYETNDHTIDYIAKHPESVRISISKTKSRKKKKNAGKYAAVATIAAASGGLATALAMDGADGGGDTGDGPVGGEGFNPGDGGGATILPGDVPR